MTLVMRRRSLALELAPWELASPRNLHLGFRSTLPPCVLESNLPPRGLVSKRISGSSLSRTQKTFSVVKRALPVSTKADSTQHEDPAALLLVRHGLHGSDNSICRRSRSCNASTKPHSPVTKPSHASSRRNAVTVASPRLSPSPRHNDDDVRCDHHSQAQGLPPVPHDAMQRLAIRVHQGLPRPARAGARAPGGSGRVHRHAWPRAGRARDLRRLPRAGAEAHA